jgi:hypothetical protein
VARGGRWGLADQQLRGDCCSVRRERGRCDLIAWPAVRSTLRSRPLFYHVEQTARRREHARRGLARGTEMPQSASYLRCRRLGFKRTSGIKQQTALSKPNFASDDPPGAGHWSWSSASRMHLAHPPDPDFAGRRVPCSLNVLVLLAVTSLFPPTHRHIILIQHRDRQPTFSASTFAEPSV